MLQNLQWDSLQQRPARSRVLMLYRLGLRNGLVAIPASTYLLPATVCTRGFETKYRQIQCNTSAYRLGTAKPSFVVQSDFETLCQLTSASCHQTSLRLNWPPSSWCEYQPSLFLIHLTALFLSVPAWFLSALLFLNTASTAHTCGPWLWVGTLLGRRREI